MPTTTIWLTDPDARRFPFPFRIGERIKSPPRGLEGVVVNAIYSGDADDDEVYWILYHIRLDDGKMLKIPLLDLESF